MLGALLLAASAAPETALLDAFKTACVQVGDLQAAEAAAASAGWAPAAEDSDPRIARLAKVGRDAAAKDGKLSGAVFRRAIGGRTVYLFLSRYEADGAWGNGCRVFDFDAPAAIAPKVADGWMGRIPTATDATGGVAKRVWDPGWNAGITVEVDFVPAGSTIAQATGLQGVVLVAQTFGASS